MDASSSDLARLLRVLAVRVLVLAVLVGITGTALLTIVFVLAGLGLLLASVDAAAEHRQDVP
ncbi:hypothetical protein T261_7630 [Streptomyces lydicus]|uniref:Uncharacterized protein n=1 Tax=Streptomyces chattanoogensis TaxID=66876 RepID=A0A0N0GUW3_9ACTN|nr:hypothetical protein [Streptomyces chattanoogensis]AJT69227.1 hypothetical protein T261_7630 [Streptomyces lydicus]KPC58420.1 hypothetical protein ADL29_38915 [Streptomyces chattanoogensis]